MENEEGNIDATAHVLFRQVFWGQEALPKWWGPSPEEAKGKLASRGLWEVSVGEALKDCPVQTNFTDGEIEAKEGMWRHGG